MEEYSGYDVIAITSPLTDQEEANSQVETESSS